MIAHRTKISMNSVRNKNEAHVPTEQNQKKKKIWIPSPHENSGWKKSFEQTPSSRTQVTGCLKFTRNLRLTKRREFQRVTREGTRMVGEFLCVDVRQGSSQKLGITASGKYGSSPQRSRFKRLVREAFRTGRSLFPPHIEINVVPRQRAKGAKSSDIRSELIKLLS
jgi:ribonuclease P protein component